MFIEDIIYAATFAGRFIVDNKVSAEDVIIDIPQKRLKKQAQ